MRNGTLKLTTLICLVACLALGITACGDDEWTACSTYSGIDKDNDGIDDGCDPCLGDKENKCAQEKVSPDAGTPSTDAGPPPASTCRISLATGLSGNREIWVIDFYETPARFELTCEDGEICKKSIVSANSDPLGRWAVFGKGFNAVRILNSDGGYPTMQSCELGKGLSWKQDVVKGKPVGEYVLAK